MVKIIEIGEHDLEVIVNKDDCRGLRERERTTGNNYGEKKHKLLVHIIYYIDKNQKAYAEVDKNTGRVDIYLTHKILNNTEISESIFSKKLDNLTISSSTDEESLKDMQIKVIYHRD